MANVRTFKNLQDEVLAWLDEVGETGITLTLIKQAIRAAHEKRLMEERWPFALAAPRTFTTTAGQTSYSLTSEFLRMQYVKNLTSNVVMQEYVADNLLSAGYNWSTDTGSATSYSLDGHWEVRAQPPVPSMVTVASTNTGDNGVASVTLLGDGGGLSETIFAGTTGLQVFSQVLKVSRSPGWVGGLILTAGATQLLTLTPTELGRSYQVMSLLPTPTAAEVLEYRYYRQPSALVNDNDRPDYPAPFEELLVWEALLDLATYNSYDGGMIAYWTQKRNALLITMGQLLNEAQSINRMASYTDFIPR